MPIPIIFSGGPNAYVEVEGRIGVTYFTRCRMEHGERGALIVIALDNPDGYRNTYPPGFWKSAKQVNDSEQLEASWIAAVPVAVPCSQCTREAWHERKNPDHTRSYLCPVGHITVITREDQW